MEAATQSCAHMLASVLEAATCTGATIVAGPSLDLAPEPLVRGQGLGEDMVGEDIVGALLVLALAALLGEAPRSRSRLAGEEQRRKK